MARRGQLTRIVRYFAVLVALSLFAATSSAGEELSFANGIRAWIHAPEEILWSDPALKDAAGGPYQLQDDPENWYPFARDEVVSALSAMRGFRTDVAVDVYILPTAPVDGGRSWSTRDAIFLVPGFGPVAPETVAYITTHEMGHVLTWAHIDAYPDRWADYLELRGIADDKYATGGEHAWLPREILAEDLRFLFGGGLATITGSIENHDLLTPDQVPGLRELLVDYLEDRTSGPAMARSCAFPNPCNPRTTIRMNLPAGTPGDVQADLRIYDIRGSLIRRLTGGQSGQGVVEIPWDGLDNHGGAVASGRYLYVMKTPELMARGAVTLVR